MPVLHICSAAHSISWTCLFTSVLYFTLLLGCSRDICFTYKKHSQNLLQQIDAFSPSVLLDNMQVMVIVWRLRWNIIRTAVCWIVRHNVHCPQHTYMSSSYKSNRLGLSHWDPYTVRRGSCLGLYYCNMMEWF